MKIEKSIDLQEYYCAWPDESLMDPKWKPVLNLFYNLMQQNSFVYVSYQQRWYLPLKVYFLHRKDMDDAEFKAVEMFLNRLNIPYAVVPSNITKQLNCQWITNNSINAFITRNPKVYAALAANTQCNLLSYSLQNVDDFKTLINFKVFPLANGATFQLQKRSYYNESLYYITTDEIQSSMLPTNERCLDGHFFKSNAGFLERLKKMLGGSKSVLTKGLCGSS